MAYTPINWQTGDTITAEKLNKMDNGWGIENTQLFSETVTTEAGEYGNEGLLAFSSIVSSSNLSVTFDGVDYQCPLIEADFGYGYGGFTSGGDYDFSVFPFALVFVSGYGNILATETAGVHTVSVFVVDMQTSSDFDKARGYGYVTGSPTELFSETVTTADTGSGDNIADLTYSQRIDADSITVTFDGTDYACPRIDADGGSYFYGGFSSGPDFTNYPFFIFSGDVNQLITQTAGEHTVAVTASVTTMQTSADFAKAVGISNKLPFFISIGITTWQEAHDAMSAGRMAYTYNPLSNRLCLAVFATSNTATDTYTITCMTIMSSSTFATDILSALSPTDPLAD